MQKRKPEIEEERKIKKDIEFTVSKLNSLIIRAANNDIEIRLDNIDVTVVGDRVPRNQIVVDLFKKL